MLLVSKSNEDVVAPDMCVTAQTWNNTSTIFVNSSATQMLHNLQHLLFSILQKREVKDILLGSAHSLLDWVTVESVMLPSWMLLNYLLFSCMCSL